MNKQVFYDLVERVTLRVALHLLKVSGGFRAKLITLLVEKSFDTIIVPLFNKLYREGRFIIDTRTGKQQVIILRRAMEGGNDEEVDDAIDDIFTT